ncbi:MAG: glycosyl transferase group 1 [Verrucomicrobia bacterium]|nr:glycosyl transferase group 1 [Verrucomicrobiota bacterium]
MKICMMTNTYLPHVGGVARSVSTFAEQYVRRKHEVLVVAPEFPGPPPPAKAEALVERVSAIRNFNGSEFSVRLPLAAALSTRLDEFAADIIHAHHPFLLGDTALRVAANKNVPIVFTHHTRYEDYVHYLPFDSDALVEIATDLPTRFANLCDGVIAPSESIERLIRRRGVTVPIRVVPTGVDVKAFARGNRASFRARMGISSGTFVVGCVSRLAPEKNLGYLASAVGLFLRKNPRARFLVVGEGPSTEALKASFAKSGTAKQLILAGKQTGAALCAAYRAMDLFVFSSRSETQGMVIAEAMAAGLPVVALSANGVREVVRDGDNGLLAPARATPAEFAQRIAAVARSPALRRKFSRSAHATAEEFSRERSAERALEFYREIRQLTRPRRLANELHPWESYLERIAVEWKLLATKTQSLAAALMPETAEAKAS